MSIVRATSGATPTRAADTLSEAAPASPGFSVDELPGFSPTLHRWFVFYVRRYFARHFDAVRVSREGGVPEDDGRPLIVYTNHPSWWDPIHFMLLAHLVLPGRRVYGPFDARALDKYRFFTKLGAFPVERGSRRGLARFLRQSRGVLALPGASLWITAEGEFTDPRRRPVRLLPGLAHLVRRPGRGRVIPLAVEYPFWGERRPEALTRFGPAIEPEAEPERSTEEWTALLAARLERTLDALAAEAQTRDPARFLTLVRGRAGVGGIYDHWRRLRAALGGERFDAAHGEDR